MASCTCASKITGYQHQLTAASGLRHGVRSRVRPTSSSRIATSSCCCTGEAKGSQCAPRAGFGAVQGPEGPVRRHVGRQQPTLLAALCRVSPDACALACKNRGRQAKSSRVWIRPCTLQFGIRVVHCSSCCDDERGLGATLMIAGSGMLSVPGLACLLGPLGLQGHNSCWGTWERRAVQAWLQASLLLMITSLLGCVRPESNMAPSMVVAAWPSPVRSARWTWTSNMVSNGPRYSAGERPATPEHGAEDPAGRVSGRLTGRLASSCRESTLKLMQLLSCRLQLLQGLQA